MLIHNLVATGSLSYNGVNISYVTGSQTSLDGLNQFSASVNTTTGSLNTATGSLFTASGSFSTRVTKIEGNYVTTGSNTFIGTQIITGSVLITSSLSVTGCIVSTGQIVAQTLNVQQVTSSIVYSSGSNTFGCSITDVQQMTGSVRITGSLSTVGVSCFSSAVCAPTIIGTTNINTGTSCIVDSHMLNVNGDQASVNVGLSLRNTNATYPKVFGLTNVNGNLNLYDYTANTQRLRIDTNGIACFACQKCAPGMDIMPSGIGVSTLGGIMRVVTTGTSTGIAVGQSNSNRYTHFAANDIQVFNDDFFLSTRCAFPLSIGTCYTARLTFAATGIATFTCQVCTPGLYLGSALVSSGDAAAITLKQTSTTAATGIYLERSGEQKGYYMYVGGGVDSLTFQRNNAGTKADVMALTRDGNVGIGCTSPANTLHINGTLRNGGASTYWYSGADASGMYIETAGATTATRTLRIQGVNDAATKYTQFFIKAGSGEMCFVTEDAQRLLISCTGIASFACQVCAPNLITTGTNSSVRGGDSAFFRGSTVTQSGNSITFDAFRFLNPTGGLGGAASAISGRLYMSFQDTSTGGNQVSYQYLIFTTGNGVSPGPSCFVQLYCGPVRGTNPISAISLVNDGAGGAVKVQATTAASGVAGAVAYITFVGTAV